MPVKKPVWMLTCILLAIQAQARGVTPYLPLNLPPGIERQIEQVLLLADKPLMKRPIAAATVLDALPEACRVDELLCESVRRYLSIYMHSYGVSDLHVEVAATSEDAVPMANRQGMATSSDWQASIRAYFQPSDYALLSVGGVAYAGASTPAGSVFSAGFEYAQLDVGFRERWLSPFTGNAMILSTEAQTMPSLTVSNYTPMTRLGLSYEVFLAEMSESDRIAVGEQYTTGKPQLFGLQLSMEPASGWSLGFNRIMQFGGGDRGGNSISDVISAFFRPSSYDNRNDDLSQEEEFGNQAASFTSRLLFPGRVPLTVYLEYAGEDTSRSRDYLLGNSALSIGIDIPELFADVSLTYEVSEWQNGWYVHGIYQDGLTHEGRVIGHWGAAHRIAGDGIGAQTHMLKLGWTPPFGGLLEVAYRTLANEEYAAYDYERLHDISVRYSRDWKSLSYGTELQAGRDVFGENYHRFAAFLSYPHGGVPRYTRGIGNRASTREGEMFVDVGISAGNLRTDIAPEVSRTTSSISGMHLAAGLRRPVSHRSDLGVRIELDDVEGSALLAVRAIDYRYRATDKIALSLFVGAARYDLATPAYGLYYGIGAQWRDVLPKYDIGLDVKYADKIARDLLAPGDPVSARGDSFYDVALASINLSRRW